ncbi:hypothetical protein CsSME_00024197 [Camellia sinensis var. sinensis]
MTLEGPASVRTRPPRELTPCWLSKAKYEGAPNRVMTVVFHFNSLFSAFSAQISTRASLYMRWSRESWAFN